MQNRDNAIRDITQEKVMEEIINKCETCHVAMVDGNKPYLLGFNFGYKDKTIYLHCAKEGKKIDILRINPNVCVYFNSDLKIFARHEEVACSWRMRYRSIMCNGIAEFVDNYQEKLDALKTFMEHYTYMDVKFSKPAIDNIQIIKIKIDEWTGRSFEYI